MKTNAKSDEKPSSKKKIIVAVIIICFAFFGSFLIYFIMCVALNTTNPMVVVISWSMDDTIKKGDLLFLKGVDDKSTLKNGTSANMEGDIIVFDARGLWVRAPEEPIVHRIVDMWYNSSGWWFWTQGDNRATNPDHDDAPIPENRILGVVVGGIPYIGWIKIWLTESGMLIPLLVILSCLLIISIIWDIIQDEEEESEKKKKDKFKKVKKSLEDSEIKKPSQKIKEAKSEDDDFDF